MCRYSSILFLFSAGLVSLLSISCVCRYMGLVKPNDPPDYEKTKFNQLRLDNFKFFLVSKNPYPKEELLDQMYPIQVFLPDN